MRNAIILLFGVFMISCNQTKKDALMDKSSDQTVTNKEQIDGFDWILGAWKRLDEEEGKETFENWHKVSKSEYAGIGFTIQNGDTINSETIQLIKANQGWNLLVKTPEEDEPITFIGTSHTDTEFTCENNEIDFPNKIKYWKNGDKINASVSNDELEIPFEFERLDL